MMGKVELKVKIFLFCRLAPIDRLACGKPKMYKFTLSIFFKSIYTHGNAEVHSSGGVSIQSAVPPSANIVYAYIYSMEQAGSPTTLSCAQR